MQPHVADHHQISDETLAARIRSSCLTRTVPHKICAAARTNVPLFNESKSTRNPTTVVSDPSHNPHKHYCQIKMGNVKCRTLYMPLVNFKTPFNIIPRHMYAPTQQQTIHWQHWSTTDTSSTALPVGRTLPWQQTVGLVTHPPTHLPTMSHLFHT